MQEEGVQLFVGLPIDAVSDCNTINHARAITAGLKALKLLGCEGVEIPVWWGIVEKEAMGKYEWSGYLALAKMVQNVGLKLRVSIAFHGSKDLKVPLPQWISKIGESQPDIFFTNKSGERYEECLSFGVDVHPVLHGKSPMQVYEGFLESFRSTFSDFIGSTITDITIGLGPNGELRYPSCPTAKLGEISGAGEFHCHDEYMLNSLKHHAQKTGNANWGYGGPHDAPSCVESPIFNGFFKDNGGSWETPYGNFFLSWYSSNVIWHGEYLLSIASRIFRDSPVNLSGKIPLLPSWYKMKSHPAELTAGFYNTHNRDGYDDIAQMFSRYSCKMILPGMELSDKFQPEGLLSSPELLFSQIKKACKKHNVRVYGENLKYAGTHNGMDQIQQNLIGDGVKVDLFTYQRMGAYFFSPEHFPTFTEFVRNLNQSELQSDDMPDNEQASRSSLSSVSETGKDRQMQEA
ncbi:beta-amylase [Ranunculus cassubicifolius]